MAKGDSGFQPSGKDAASTKPTFIPDDELLGRDDSGGPDFDPYNQQFGDGGFVTGGKAHLNPGGRGGKDDATQGDEISQEPREREYQAQVKGDKKSNAGDVPAKSKRLAKE